MIVLQNATSIGKNLKTVFEGSAGTPPYSYAVLGGGAGGTIGAATGIYTAPNVTGIDTIEVTDFLLATAQATINIVGPIELICDIIKSELSLDDDQIWIYNQKFDIPADSRLYVVVGVGLVKPFSNINRMESVGLDLVEVQSMNVAATLSIDIFSRSVEALERKEEVLMALKSIYSEQQQELNGLKIGVIPTGFVNLSEEEGAAILYRFNASIVVQYAISKTKAVDFYDTFEDVEVITDP